MKSIRHLIQGSLAIALTVLLVPPTLAQDNAQEKDMLTVQVGDPVIDASFIQPFAQWYTLISTDAAGNVLLNTRWDYRIEIKQEEGRAVLHRLLHGYNTDGSTFLTLDMAVDHKTLAPLTMAAEQGGQVISGTYDDGTYAITAQLPGQPQPIERSYDLGDPFFDYQNLHGVMLLGFPLEEGFSAQFPTYYQNRNTGAFTRYLRQMHVRHQERVDSGPRKNLEAWRVETDDVNGDHWIYWLSREAPYVLKVVVNQADGGQRVFEMAEE